MKTTLLVRSLLGLMLLVAAGCGDWSRRSSRSGLLIEPEDAAKLGYVVTWSNDLGVPNNHNISSATILGDTLFTVEAPDNMVTAISIRNGDVLWRRVIGENTESIYKPIRDEEHVYFNNDTTLFTLGAINGKLMATSQLAHVVETGPVMMDRYAIYGAANGTVFAHDIDTGYAKWAYMLTGGIVVPPVESERYVFTADSKGIYASLEAISGELIFRGRAFGPITAKPAVSRNAVYVASQDQTLYAVNRLNGRDMWVYRYTKPLTLDPATFGQVVYLPLPGDGLIALDANTGDEMWRTPLQGKVVGHSQNKVMLHHPDGIQWVDEGTGRVLVDVETMPLQEVIPVTDNGGLVIISPSGRIHRLLPKR